MPKVVIDTSKAEQREGFTTYDGPKPPVGLYKAILKSAWWGMSKGNNGNEPKPMLTIVLELKAKNPDKAKYDGYAIWQRITHQESTLWRMQQLFVALGQPKKAGINVSEKDGPFGKVVLSIGQAQVGKVELLVKAKDEYYQGNTKLGVDTLSPLPGVEVDEAFEEDGDETSFEESQNMTAEWATANDIDASDDKWDPESEETPF